MKNLLNLSSKNILSNLLTILLATILIAMPYGIKVLPQLLSLSFLIWLISCFAPKKINGDFLQDKTIYLLPAYALISTLTLLWSTETMEGAKVLERMISFVIMPFLFVTHSRRIKVSINTVYTLLGISILIATLVLIWEFHSKIGIEKINVVETPFEKLRYIRYYIMLEGLAIHPSYLSYLAIIYLSFSLFQKGKSASIHILFSVFAIVLILVLYSRGALLTLLFLIAYGLFKQLYLKRYALFAIIAFIGLASLFVSYKYTRLGDTIRGISSENSVQTEDARITVWRNSFQLIKEKPLFGYGIGDAIHVIIDKHEETGFEMGVEKRLDAHNQFLEVWLQAGLLGLIPLLLVFAFPLFQSIKFKQEYLFLFLIISIIQHMFESMFVRLAGVVYFGFFYCYLYLVYYKGNREIEI